MRRLKDGELIKTRSPLTPRLWLVLKPEAFVLGTAHLCFSHQIVYKASPPDTPQPPVSRHVGQNTRDPSGPPEHKPRWSLMEAAKVQKGRGQTGLTPKQPSPTAERWSRGPSAVYEALGESRCYAWCGDASMVTPRGSQHLRKVGVGAATLWLQRTGKCAAHPSTYVLAGSGCDFSPRRLRFLRTWRFTCAMPSQEVMTRRQIRRLCRQIFQPASLLGARVPQRARLHSYSVGIPRRAGRRAGS